MTAPAQPLLASQAIIPNMGTSGLSVGREKRLETTVRNRVSNTGMGGCAPQGQQEALPIAESLKQTQVSPPHSMPDILDLFSGCGGLSMGFENAGFKVLGAYDNWSCAVDTYNLNHSPEAPSEAKLLDLSDVDATIEELKKYERPGRPFPAIVGGPPCQDFSSAGNRIEGDRADLTEKFALIVERFQPEFFLMENVSMAAKAGVYNNAIDHMRSQGYFVQTTVLDASLTGVPQSRKRLIAFGSKNKSLVTYVLAWWQDNLAQSPMTIREYLRDTQGIELDFDHYYRHPRSYARRGVFSVDEPSPTIRGVNRPIPATYVEHPADPVSVEGLKPLTTSQRAQIQTFPADFKFSCARTNAEQLIGNAVPVKLGEYIARGIRSGIKSH